MTISAVIIAKNAASSLKNCLESLTWCQEIIVIDDNSADETVKIADRYGAKVYKRELTDNFSAQRNYGLEKATGEWVLFIDADEVAPSSLAQEIQTKLQHTTAQGFLIQRIDTMWGKKLLHGEAGNTFLLRLARKDAGVWEGKVHETWHMNGKVERLHNPLAHFPHPTINEFLTEINFYTTLRAEELYAKGVRVSIWDIIMYPKAKFIINFIFKQGFQDGIQGLVVAILMSFHSFLVRGKLWQLHQKK